MRRLLLANMKLSPVASRSPTTSSSTVLSTCCLHLVVIATTAALAYASELNQVPQESLQQCCTSQLMTPTCSDELCGIQSSHVSLSCYFDIDKVLRCLSGRRNSSRCCEARQVPSHCGQLCTGPDDSRVEMTINDVRCLRHLPAISYCFHQVYVADRLPGPPSDVTVVSVTSSEIELRWSRPTFNADRLQSYVIQYKSRDRSRDAGRRDVIPAETVTSVETTISLHGLTPSTVYELSVVAVGDKGTSWPSSPLVIMTYPLSNPEGHVEVTEPTANNTHHQELLSEPRELVVTNKTHYSLSLSWKQPAFNAHLVSGYRVQYRMSDADLHAGAEKWNTVMVGSSQTEVILLNLRSDSVYRVIVTAVSVPSPRQPLPGRPLLGRPSPVITVRTLPEGAMQKVEVMKDLTECCRDHNVSWSCMAACTGSGVVNTRTCAQELHKIIACAADGEDHTQCCLGKAVPTPCHDYCTGRSPDTNLKAFLCLAYIDEIFTCFIHTTGRLPKSPERFELVDMSLTSASFSWTTEPQLAYRLYYRSLSADDSYRLIEDVRSPCTLDGLTPSTTYSVYVVAVNQFGVSDPSAVVSFQLSPPDTGSVRIVQSPAGLVSLGSRLLLSCSYTADMAWPADVAWVRRGRRVDGNLFVIDSVDKDDDGRYTCVINKSGRMLSADTIVRVQFSPTATAVQRLVQADRGHSAHLVCRFTGHPDSISWYHGRTGAPVVGSRYSVTRYIHEDIGAVDSRLSIDRVTRRDYGSYRCQASNVYSTADALITLTGLDVVVPTVQSTASQATSLSQPSTMSCCVERGVGVRCRGACREDVIAMSAMNDMDSHCVTDLPNILHCVSGGLNHTACCLVNSVPPHCLSLCVGGSVVRASDAVSTSDVQTRCLPFIDVVVSCVHQLRANTPSQPGNVRLSMTSSGHVLVAWDAPEVNPHLVEFYRVEWTAESDGRERTNSSLVRERSVTLADVEPFTTYDVIVAAGNRDVMSMPSVPAHITTHERVPSEPWRVAAELLNAVNVRLSWQPPKRSSQNVVAYVVYCVRAESADTRAPVVRRVDGTARECVIKQLKANTPYVLYVSAATTHYESQHSSQVLISTADLLESVTATPAKYHHKVALAVCLVLLCVVAVVSVVIARRYCCTVASKQHSRRDRLSDSVLFENLTYSRLADVTSTTVESTTTDGRCTSSSTSSSLSSTHHHHQQQQQQQQQRRRLEENGHQQNYNTQRL